MFIGVRQSVGMNSKLVGIESDTRIQHLIGNALCLDFANTLYGHAGPPIHDYLYGYHDLVLWSHKVGILTVSDAEKLVRAAARRPNDALAVYHRAIALRESIYRIFAALAKGQNQ